MGLVEEIYTPAGNENDVDTIEAANANFVIDRENEPDVSNPNTLNN